MVLILKKIKGLGLVGDGLNYITGSSGSIFYFARQFDKEHDKMKKIYQRYKKRGNKTINVMACRWEKRS